MNNLEINGKISFKFELKIVNYNLTLIKPKATSALVLGPILSAGGL